MCLQHHGHAGDLLAVAATAAAAATQQHRAAPTLGYVTPWNGAGYEVAKHCRCSLDYVAPVWYQLRSASSVLQLTGGHDVDAGWMAAVRAPCEQGSNHTTLIVPRVIFELQASPRNIGQAWALHGQPAVGRSEVQAAPLPP